MTQPISADQPLSTRIERVGDEWRAFVDPAWFRYFVDVGDVDLTEDVSGVLPLANGGTGISALPAVIAPTFLNGWTDFGGAYQTAGYYKDPFGIVRLRGLVAGGVVASPIFRLPAGYRPPGQLAFAVVSNASFGFVEVTTLGDVILTSGSNVYASISGVSFRV